FPLLIDIAGYGKAPVPRRFLWMLSDISRPRILHFENQQVLLAAPAVAVAVVGGAPHIGPGADLTDGNSLEGGLLHQLEQGVRQTRLEKSNLLPSHLGTKHPFLFPAEPLCPPS